MGMRIRLKASFDISKFSPTNQIILKAMKKYGMILVDNGSKLYIQGTTDSRWDDNDLGQLQSVLSANFEVVALPAAGRVRCRDSAAWEPLPVISNFIATH